MGTTNTLRWQYSVDWAVDGTGSWQSLVSVRSYVTGLVTINLMSFKVMIIDTGSGQLLKSKGWQRLWQEF